MVSCLEISGEKLGEPKVKNICETLDGEELRVLALRECKVSDKDFKKIMKSVSNCKTILQLNLNVGTVKDVGRVKILANALQKNRSLISLLVNGNPLGDEGMKILGKALALHPNIISLDIGDCNLGNDSIEIISDLLPPHGAKPGLTDLTISANSEITPRGWSKLAVAIAASSTLRELYLDYNTLGDYAASCILIALTAHRRIEVLDLEGTGITEHTAQLLSYLVDQYPVRLRKIVLDENNIKGSMKEAIKSSINWNDETSETQSEAGTDITKSEVSLSKEVKIHPVKAKQGNAKSKNDTLLEMFTAVSEKSLEEEQSDFKDTANTDEDYKALAKALEEGLESQESEPPHNKGGMSPPKLSDVEDDSDENEDEEEDEDEDTNSNKTGDEEEVEDVQNNKDEFDDEEVEELREVPVIPQSKMVFVATAPRTVEPVKDSINIGEEIVDDDEEDVNKIPELKEVPLIKR